MQATSFLASSLVWSRVQSGGIRKWEGLGNEAKCLLKPIRKYLIPAKFSGYVIQSLLFIQKLHRDNDKASLAVVQRKSHQTLYRMSIIILSDERHTKILAYQNPKIKVPFI